MKVKTLRSILQTASVLAVVLLLSLAIILIVQYVEIANLKEEIKDHEQGQQAVAEIETPIYEFSVPQENYFGLRGY